MLLLCEQNLFFNFFVGALLISPLLERLRHLVVHLLLGLKKKQAATLIISLITSCASLIISEIISLFAVLIVAL